jgi:hypothetical protein
MKKTPTPKKPKPLNYIGNGRPLRYGSADEMQVKINEYFASCWSDQTTTIKDKSGKETSKTILVQIRPYTVAGLALSLGFCNRKALFDYNKKDEFSNIIKNARLLIETNVEELLLKGGGSGPIFWLKNNAGYKDNNSEDDDDSYVTPIRIIREVVDGRKV